jgi:hypothetical protein
MERKVEGKAISVIGPYNCEMSRFPHFLESWFTNGDEVVSLMHQPLATSRKIPGNYLC